jgi:hypothetical protein
MSTFYIFMSPPLQRCSEQEEGLMSSYWDRTDGKRRREKEHLDELYCRQIEMWGWRDERVRDAAGRLLNPKPGKNRAPRCDAS